MMLHPSFLEGEDLRNAVLELLRDVAMPDPSDGHSPLYHVGSRVEILGQEVGRVWGAPPTITVTP